MYKEHFIPLIVIAVLTAATSWIFNLHYEKIASDAITVVSIAIAVCLTAITLLIGSKIADAMKHQDPKIKTKTQMGVLISYLSRAIRIGILSITVSCVAEIYCTDKFNSTHPNLQHAISSTGFSLFAATLFFMWIIFKFISAALLRNSSC